MYSVQIDDHHNRINPCNKRCKIVQLNVFTDLILFEDFFLSVENYNSFSLSFKKEGKLP